MKNDATAQIDTYIAGQPDWQQRNLKAFRILVHQVDPTIEEAWKWNVPVFMKDGKLVCAMSSFKAFTKYNFFEGAALNDTAGIFNSGLDSGKHRSLNLSDSDSIPTAAISDLIAQAIEFTKK